MITCNDPNKRLTWRNLNLNEFGYEFIYRPGLVQQIPDALSRLFTYQLIESTRITNFKMSTFESSFVALEKWLMEKGFQVLFSLSVQSRLSMFLQSLSKCQSDTFEW